MDQGVRYVVTLADINVASGLKNMESSALRAEAGVASLNNTLRTLSGALGVGFGMHALVNFGKDAIQGAADYETAIKRIKFASENFADGVRNNAFISAEADKFKIGLQETTDAYGKFLAMLNGSGIAGDQVRNLHDQLLLIGKVKGLGQGQLDAAVMNLGKMLESGSLDARHFRPLEQQLSGIGAFVAKELGITVHQLAILRNKGKMTQIDPKVLLSAIEKQAASLEKFLPESTHTIQSQINDLDNAWLRFKNDLVFKERPELDELFASLKGGIGWLADHEEGILRTGKAIVSLGKVWLEFKATMMVINTAQAAMLAFTEGYSAKAGVQVSAVERQVIAFNQLSAAMERLIYVQATANGMPTLAAMSAANAAGLNAATGAARGATALGAGMGTKLIRGATAVAIAYFTADALSQLGSNKTAEGFKTTGFDAIKAITSPGEFTKIGALSAIQEYVDKANKDFSSSGSYSLAATINEGLKKDKAAGRINEYIKSLVPVDRMGVQHSDDSTMASILKAQGVRFFGSEAEERRRWAKENGFIERDVVPGLPSAGRGMGLPDAHDGPMLSSMTQAARDNLAANKSEKFSPPQDKVTGSHVTNYNIDIKEINGIKQNTVQAGAKVNTDDVAMVLRDEIRAILNDSQIRQN